LVTVASDVTVTTSLDALLSRMVVPSELESRDCPSCGIRTPSWTSTLSVPDTCPQPVALHMSMQRPPVERLAGPANAQYVVRSPQQFPGRVDFPVEGLQLTRFAQHWQEPVTLVAGILHTGGQGHFEAFGLRGKVNGQWLYYHHNSSPGGCTCVIRNLSTQAGRQWLARAQTKCCWLLYRQSRDVAEVIARQITVRALRRQLWLLQNCYISASVWVLGYGRCWDPRYRAAIVRPNLPPLLARQLTAHSTVPIFHPARHGGIEYHNTAFLAAVELQQVAASWAANTNGQSTLRSFLVSRQYGADPAADDYAPQSTVPADGLMSVRSVQGWVARLQNDPLLSLFRCVFINTGSLHWAVVLYDRRNDFIEVFDGKGKQLCDLGDVEQWAALLKDAVNVKQCRVNTKNHQDSQGDNGTECGVHCLWYVYMRIAGFSAMDLMSTSREVGFSHMQTLRQTLLFGNPAIVEQEKNA
jgi:hypothetical protein